MIPKLVIIHCSMTPAKKNLTLRDIDRESRKEGFFNCKYHYVIQRDGTTGCGRPDHMPGGHTPGFNNCSIGVLMIGGKTSKDDSGHNFPDIQLFSLEYLLQALIARYPGIQIKGAYELETRRKKYPMVFDVEQFLLDREIYPDDSKSHKPRAHRPVAPVVKG